jgi:hypothetical protein
MEFVRRFGAVASTPDQVDRERARGVRQSLLHDGRSGAVRLVETAARFAGGRDRGQTRRQWDQLHGQSERRSPGDLADSVDSSSATYWDLLLLRVRRQTINRGATMRR